MITPNGNVAFLDSGLGAAQQAGLDVANFAAQDNGGGAGASVSAPAVSAVAAIANAVFSGGNLGVNIANAVDNETTGQLQINLVNYSSAPVIVYDYNPDNANVTDVPAPLAPGDNDLFVLTSEEQFDSDSALGLNVLVGAGTSGSIQTEFTYSYTENGNPGRWTVSAVVDGANHDFPSNLQLFGLTFTGSSGYPSFSVYTSTIETASGVLSIAVYDLAPVAHPN
jgi:hypothetical protein